MSKTMPAPSGHHSVTGSSKVCSSGTSSQIELVLNRPLSFEVDTTLVPIKLVEFKVGIVVVKVQHTGSNAGARHVERAPGDLLV